MTQAATVVSGDARDDRRSRTFTYLGLAVLVLLVVTPPVGNHSEAEDAFLYALQVESLPYSSLWHPHHAVYHPLMKTFYNLSGAERSFPVMQLFSRLCAAGAVVLFWLLLGRTVAFSPRSQIAVTACFALSYGFWRYANEVEVYSFAILVALAHTHLLLTLRGALRGATVGFLAGASGVALALAHGALLALAAATIVYLWLVRMRRAAMTAALVMAMGLVAMAALPPHVTESDRAAEPTRADGRDRGFRLSSPVRGAVGLGQSIVSGSAVMRIDPVYRTLSQRLFANRNLSEERYTSLQLSETAAVVICLATLAFAATLAIVWLRCLWALWPGHRAGSPGFEPTLFGLWFAFHAIAILWYEPGNPEMWVLGLPPLWLLFATLWPRSGMKSGWLVALALGMAAVNHVGGMRLVRSADWDYNRASTSVAVREGESGDVLLHAIRRETLDRYVRYLSPVEPLNVRRTADRDPASLDPLRGRIFVHETAVDVVGERLTAGRLAAIARDERTGLTQYEWVAGEEDGNIPEQQ